MQDLPSNTTAAVSALPFSPLTTTGLVAAAEATTNPWDAIDLCQAHTDRRLADVLRKAAA